MITAKPFAIGSDAPNALTDAIIGELSKHVSVSLFGALNPNASSEEKLWVPAAQEVARAIQSGISDFGILFCYTGTGVAMAANKFKGIRAALCTDKETAIGARRWNDANVLVMSLRLTTPTLGLEILQGFLSTVPDTDAETQFCLNALQKLDSELS